MILAALMKQIQSNELQPYYIFECEDRTISDMYLANMEKCGLKRIVVDDTLTALKNNSAGSLLKQQRKLFIIKDDKSVTTNDKIWPLIKSVKNATFVFIFTTIDKRTQFYKQFEDNIVTFSKLRADVLAKHIKGKSNITDVQLKELIKLTDNCYGYALSELDKVCGYAQASDISDSEAYQILRSNDMIGNEPNDNLFRAIDAMLNGDIHKTYLYLKDEEPVSTLAAMFSSIKQLWLVRCYGRNEVLKEFGINDMQININLGRRTIYNNNQLKRLLMFSIDVEQKMKFGIIPMENAIDYFVSHAMTI